MSGREWLAVRHVAATVVVLIIAAGALALLLSRGDESKPSTTSTSAAPRAVGLQLGGRAIWPVDPDHPGSDSPAGTVSAFVGEFIAAPTGIDFIVDETASPTDPTWVTVLSDGREITRVLTVPDADGRWAILQLGEAATSVSAGARVTFPPFPEAYSGVIAWGTGDETQLRTITGDDLRGGSFQSDAPVGLPYVIVVFNSNARLIGLLGRG